MKALSIIRHAKTKRSEQYANDFERPLTERGRKDALRIGKRLARIRPTVGQIISSSALRTTQTTTHLSKVLRAQTGTTPPVLLEDELYLATADTLRMALQGAAPDAEHVALVGHNPGMENLVSALCAGAEGRVHLNMPTGTLAHLELEIFHWSQIRWGCSRLRLFLPPKFTRK